jgi:hypothetical protein
MCIAAWQSDWVQYLHATSLTLVTMVSMVTLVTDQRSNSFKHARIITLCVQLLTFSFLLPPCNVHQTA